MTDRIGKALLALSALALLDNAVAMFLRPAPVEAQGDPRGGRWVFHLPPSSQDGTNRLLMDSPTGELWTLGLEPRTGGVGPVLIRIPKAQSVGR